MGWQLLESRLKRGGADDPVRVVPFLTVGYPDMAATEDVAAALEEAGAAAIELGVPFSDPLAEGPTIQRSSEGALAQGVTLRGCIATAAGLRRRGLQTPLVLMGYYNPIHNRGSEQFISDAVEAGADGLIIVDLPPEEDEELCIPAQNSGLNFIRLATPTTDDRRLRTVLRNTSGFVYYVSITGITGAAAANAAEVAPDVARIKSATELPVCVGFGIKTPDAAREIASISDGAVVGSSIVSMVEQGQPVERILAFVSELSAGAHQA